MELAGSVGGLSKNQKIIGGGVLVLVAVVVTAAVLYFNGTFDGLLIKYGLKDYPLRSALTLDQVLKVATPSYSLRYPGSWGTDYKDNVVSIYSKETGAKTSGESPAGILARPWLLADKENASMSDIANLWRQKLQLSYPGVKILTEREINVNSKEAYYFDILYSEDKNNLSGGKNSFHAYSYIIRDGKYLHQILATSFDSLWPLYKNTLTSIAESFQSP
ncbi:MAG: hypothetical protein NT141_01230 [candidate division WWE3 bacterium]|nr:hypothetical protein [candidate division WWE3 bacterium]